MANSSMLVLPVTALVVGGFATLTMLTKNSFLDEMSRQYVITARAKGAGERQVLYGHVLRNAMLMVVADVRQLAGDHGRSLLSSRH